MGKCRFSSAATSAFSTFKICRSADPHFTPGHSRTGHLADWSTLGLDKSRTGQLADATGNFACLVFVLLVASARPRIVRSATCPVRELTSARDVESASWQSASCPVTPKVGLPRVLEYYSSFFPTRVLVNFYFRLQIFISGCSFLQSLDEFLEFVQSWGFAISFAICQPGNTSEYYTTHVEYRGCYAASSGALQSSVVPLALKYLCIGCPVRRRRQSARFPWQA